MSAELAELNSFIAAIPPFDTLDDDALSLLVKHIHIEYVRSGTAMPPQSDANTPHLYIIRKGAIAYYDEQDALLSMYGEGDMCSVFLRSDNRGYIHRVAVEEDTLLYAIASDDLNNAMMHSSALKHFFSQSAAERLKKRMQQFNEEAILSSTLMNTQVADFYHAPAGTVDVHASIQHTAVTMTELGYSCLVVTDEQQIVGIVTDKDIRKRCVATGLSTQLPVSEIMSDDLLTLDINSSAYDALITMTSRNIHHLPVLQHGELAGMVTVTDLMNHEGHNAVNMTNMIRKAQSIKELSQISKLIPKLQIRMATLGTTAEHVGKSISAITMAFTIRLIHMAEQLLGPAPVPYAWLAAGSQARQEQFAHSDQDNALIIHDDMKPEHDQWFHDFATFVCDGLAACGFIYCPGDVMATNPKWRQPQRVWHRYFSQWVDTPSPRALLNSSVFFDLATVYGDTNLLADVRHNMLQSTQKNTLFIAHLSKNALSFKPPLGFFRDFVLIESGDNQKVMDLKHRGITPIVDLARIYALQEGVEAVNTIERLKAVAGTPSLSEPSARNLIDAFEFLSFLRMEHQAKLLKQGKKPDNLLPPKSISRLEREHLKDAFKVIKTMQSNRQVAF